MNTSVTAPTASACSSKPLSFRPAASIGQIATQISSGTPAASPCPNVAATVVALFAVGRGGVMDGERALVRLALVPGDGVTPREEARRDEFFGCHAAPGESKWSWRLMLLLKRVGF